MRFLFWILLLFALAVTFSLVAQVNGGLVMFVLPPWRVELSLNAFILLLVGVFPLIYGVLRLVFIGLSLPDRVRAYREARRRQIIMRDTTAALIALFSGRFRKAEKAAQHALESRPEPDLELVNSLVAARAAHYTRNYASRDQHLAHVSTLDNTDAQLAILMTRAHLANEARDYTEALQAITEARSISPNLTSAMQLELSLRQRLEQPDKVLALLEPLTRAEAVAPSVVARIRRQAYLQQLATLQLDARQWAGWWQKVAAELRQDPRLAEAAARRFMELGEYGLAVNTVLQALEHEWDERLLYLFGEPELHGTGEAGLIKGIQQGETWLQQQPRDANLLLMLARLCRAARLWGKARSYAEASIAIAPSALAHLELAELSEREGQHDEASGHIRHALNLSLGKY